MKDLQEYANKIVEVWYNPFTWGSSASTPQAPTRGYEGGKVNMNRGGLATPYQDTLKSAGQQQTAMDLRATGPKTSQPGRTKLPNQADLKQKRLEAERQKTTDLANTRPAARPPVPQDPMSANPQGGYKHSTQGATPAPIVQQQLDNMGAPRRPGYETRTSTRPVAQAPRPITSTGMRDGNEGESQARAYKQQYLDKYGKKASAFDKQFAAAAVQGKKEFTYTGPKTGKQRDIAVKFKGNTPAYVGRAQQQIKDETK
jgi:hypothetical protein